MQATTLTKDPPRRRVKSKWDLTAQQRRLYGRIPSNVSYMDDPSFAAPEAEQKYFGDNEAEAKVPAWTYFPEVPEDEPARRKQRPRLKPHEEANLFLRYNYARYRLSKLVEAQKQKATLASAREMVLWFQRAMKARAALVRANMALVLAMAKRTRIPNVEFGELISEGNMALLRSVEKFDVSRGFRFSTYACRAILKSFNRLATKTARYRQRYCTEYDPGLERSDHDENKHQMQRDSSLESLREILAENRADLSDVERKIVMERFAIGSDGKGRTLAEVGKMVRLTNERVRQIQKLAIGKIRDALYENY